MLFTCIKSWFFRNHLPNFHQISHWSFCWNVIDSLFKWSCSIDCQAHIFFFKTKNCPNDDIFRSCDDRIGKMLHNICMSAGAMSLRWANRGLWASCFFFWFSLSKKHMLWVLIWIALTLCLYKVVDKKYTSCDLKTTELLDCVLIGACAVIRSNTVNINDHNHDKWLFFHVSYSFVWIQDFWDPPLNCLISETISK